MILRNNIRNLFTQVMQAYAHKILIENEFDGGPNHFIILGCDVAPDENLDVKLLEINKGPDLNMKDSRDGNLKYNMVKEALQILNIIEPSSCKEKCNYIKVL